MAKVTKKKINKKKEDDAPLKKKAGQPRSFQSKEILEQSLIGYLVTCEAKKQMPNKAGFCFFAKISRETYYVYKKDKVYSDTIREFELAVEDKWVNRLSGSSATGAIFYLKNAFSDEYKDRVETDITSKGEQIHIYIPQRK